MFIPEILAALAAILMTIVPGFFTHHSKGKGVEPPKPPIAALPKPSPAPSTSPSISPSTLPDQTKKVPTPALLPGLLVFAGSALRKKGQKDGSTSADS